MPGRVWTIISYAILAGVLILAIWSYDTLKSTNEEGFHDLCVLFIAVSKQNLAIMEVVSDHNSLAVRQAMRVHEEIVDTCKRIP